MVKKHPRISKTGVTSGGLYSLYSNSKERKDLDPAIVREIAGNSLSSLYLSSENTVTEDISEEYAFVIAESDSESEAIFGVESVNQTRSAVPSLSDISIVSNTVVYDAAGQPSVTLIFKVKNSSGEALRGMNAKVELL